MNVNTNYTAYFKLRTLSRKTQLCYPCGSYAGES